MIIRLMRTLHYFSFAIAILGSLFKIQYWPFAGIMIVVSIGMSLIVSGIIAYISYRSNMERPKKMLWVIIPLVPAIILAIMLQFGSSIILALLNAASLYAMKNRGKG